ncbi:hypothetical protein A3K29_03760 [Candidatus Collierbacteria bacterium RIFOXYB2_FULL_46_14]|nr:MAG: hypothetical protein A3K29_03760 [Candidatus Collierbacteria bacterium RIFOXYB2_FULL_46_14]OGD76273.1 MAG: hypothetical protein A3K43_03760 [Candidatus Collierbacteria bacterium RIFOXYA2_FULL_46_20]OGD77609.1 MAG: hypothetical protein A3K39_03760 [Candidatus Collierbacteria bacterium RIFOXYC2_FULL_43_15]OGD80899.1 MAG: hypothetical protein A2320_04255 [Pseudomonadales bacterium GWC2_63_15]OGD82331.1 MAG: hypothetical protein A3K36_03760 [Candidatus Collierbacteria bacterium RIFOXYD2_FUL
MGTNYFDDETLTDNLDDKQAGRIISILGKTQGIDQDQRLQIVLLLRLLNQICRDSQEMALFEDIMSKLEAKYV